MELNDNEKVHIDKCTNIIFEQNLHACLVFLSSKLMHIKIVAFIIL